MEQRRRREGCGEVVEGLKDGVVWLLRMLLQLPLRLDLLMVVLLLFVVVLVFVVVLLLLLLFLLLLQLLLQAGIPPPLTIYERGSYNSSQAATHRLELP